MLRRSASERPSTRTNGKAALSTSKSARLPAIQGRHPLRPSSPVKRLRRRADLALDQILETTLLGRDRGGRPTLLLKLRLSLSPPLSVLRRTITTEALLQWLLWAVEDLAFNGADAVTAVAANDGNIRLIIDVAGGFQLAQMEDPLLLSAIASLLKAARERYPGLLHAATVIGASPLFAFVWVGLTPLLPSATLKKIQVFSSPAAWRSVLSDAIPSALLPERYGGIASVALTVKSETAAAPAAAAPTASLSPTADSRDTVAGLALWLLQSFIVLLGLAFGWLVEQLRPGGRGGSLPWPRLGGWISDRGLTAVFVVPQVSLRQSNNGGVIKLARLLREAAASGAGPISNRIPLLHCGLASYQHLLVPGLLVQPLVDSSIDAAPVAGPAGKELHDGAAASTAEAIVASRRILGGNRRASEPTSAASTPQAGSGSPPRPLARCSSNNRGLRAAISPPPKAADSSVGDASGDRPAAARRRVTSLEGANVQVRHAIGPRRTVTFTVAVEAAPGKSSSGNDVGHWSVARTLNDFHVLRQRLSGENLWPCSGKAAMAAAAAEVAAAASVWEVPPRLPPLQMAQGLERALAAVIEEAADSLETHRFLGNLAMASTSLSPPRTASQRDVRAADGGNGSGGGSDSSGHRRWGGSDSSGHRRWGDSSGSVQQRRRGDSSDAEKENDSHGEGEDTDGDGEGSLGGDEVSAADTTDGKARIGGGGDHGSSVLRVQGIRPELGSMFADAGDAGTFRLRGATYLTDRVKVPAMAAACRLLHVDIFAAGSGPTARLDHVCARGKGAARLRRLAFRQAVAGGSLASGTGHGGVAGMGSGASTDAGSWGQAVEWAFYVVNLQLPRAGDRGAVSVVLYFGLAMEPDDGDPGSASRRFREALLRYAAMPMHACLDAVAPGTSGGSSGKKGGGSSSDGSWESGMLPRSDYRNQRLKVIAAVHKGPWAIRQAVGHGRPHPAGRRLSLRHFRGATYVEVDLDLGSTVVGAQVSGAVAGYARGLVIDVGFILEGTTPEELPEVLLGSARARYVDLSLAEPLYETREWSRHGVCPLARQELLLGEAPWGSHLPYLRPELWGMLADPGCDTTPINTAVGGNVAAIGTTTSVSAAAAPPLAKAPAAAAHGRQASLKVRGADYLSDKGKVIAGAPQSRLLHVDLFSVENPLGRVDHIALYDRAAESVGELVKAAREGADGAEGEALAADPDATLLIVNFQVPARAHGVPSLSLVCYWRLPSLDPSSYDNPADQAYARLLGRFVDVPRPHRHGRKSSSPYVDFSEKRYGEGGSGGEDARAESGEETDDEAEEALHTLGGELPKDDFRNERLKLVPLVMEGPWIVRLSMGSTPVLLGQRLKQRHFRGDGYLEVDVDLGSSRVALRAASLCVEHAKEFVAQVGLVIEGRSPEELPERLLAAVRLSHLDAVHGPTPLSDDPLEVLLAKSLGVCADAVEDGSSASAAAAARMASLPPTSPAQLRIQGVPRSPSDSLGSTVAVEVPTTSPQLVGMFWDSGNDQAFRVRGATYLRDHVKVIAGPAVGKMVRTDLFSLAGVPFRQDHVAQHGKCAAVVKALLAGKEKAESFLFILNFQVPATPPLSFVVYYELPSLDDARYIDEADQKLIRLVQRFADLPEMDPEDPGALPQGDFRNERFKIIPNVREGPWVVRSAVGNKPSLLGRKLTQRYFRGDRYMEVDVDVGSSVVAYRVTNVCAGASKALTIDIGVTLEGRDPSELPERVLGCVAVDHVDLSLSEPLYDEGAEAGGDDHNHASMSY